MSNDIGGANVLAVETRNGHGISSAISLVQQSNNESYKKKEQQKCMFLDIGVRIDSEDCLSSHLTYRYPREK